MPSLKYVVACEGHSVDRTTSALSVFNIVEDLHPRRFPARVTKLAVISSWHIAPEDVGQDFQVKLTVQVPGESTSKEFTLNFTADQDLGVIQNLNGMPVKASGTINITISINSTQAAQYSINVHEADASANDGGLLRYIRFSSAPHSSDNNSTSTPSPIVDQTQSE